LKNFTKIALGALALAIAMPISAQSIQEVTITTYRAAPGHQVELLRWLARQNQASEAAGVAAAQLYVHHQGASWDYLVIAPVTTEAQDRSVDTEAQRLGVPTGPGVGIELRRHIASHEDTIAGGPTTAAAMLAALGEE